MPTKDINARKDAAKRKRVRGSTTTTTTEAPRRARRPSGATIKSLREDSTNELSATMNEINKTFGKGTVRTGRESRQPTRIPTGIFLIDLATLGGVPNSRATMILGEKHAGKTMLSSKIIRGAQLIYPNKVPAIVDVEGTYDREWAAKNGVDMDRLILSEVENGEMAGDVLEALVRTLEVSYVTLDSVAMMEPTQELEGSMSDNHMGQQARLINRVVRKATSNIVAERKRGHDVGINFINQWRTNIGVMFGDNRTIPGGRALLHLMSLEIHLKNKEISGKRGTESKQDEEVITHNEHAFDIKKNKSNGGIRQGEFKIMRDTPFMDDLLYESASNDYRTMLTFSKMLGMHSGAGKNQSIRFNTANGAERIIQFASQDSDLPRTLYEDPELYWQLRCDIIARKALQARMPPDFIQAIYEQPNCYEHDLNNSIAMQDANYFEE